MRKGKVSVTIKDIEKLLLRPVGEPSNEVEVKIIIAEEGKLVSDGDIMRALCSAFSTMTLHNDSFITKEEYIKRHRAANPNTNYDYNKLPDFINID